MESHRKGQTIIKEKLEKLLPGADRLVRNGQNEERVRIVPAKRWEQESAPGLEEEKSGPAVNMGMKEQRAETEDGVALGRCPARPIRRWATKRH